jgi:hypothetical protein
MPANTNPDTEKVAQLGALCFVVPCVAVMRLLPEVSPQARVENETESTAISNQVGLTTLGRPQSLWHSGEYRYKSTFTGG